MAKKRECDEDNLATCKKCIDGQYISYSIVEPCYKCKKGVIEPLTRACKDCTKQALSNGRYKAVWTDKPNNQCLKCTVDGSNEVWENICTKKGAQQQCKEISTNHWACVPACSWQDKSVPGLVLTRPGCNPDFCKECQCKNDDCTEVACDKDVCHGQNFECIEGDCICILQNYDSAPLALFTNCPENRPTVVPILSDGIFGTIQRVVGCECKCLVEPKDCAADQVFNSKKCRCEHPCADPDNPTQSRCNEANCEECAPSSIGHRCKNKCKTGQICDGMGSCYDKGSGININFIP